MIIVFNALKTNISNTGGNLSIVETAEILENLGHEVYIVASKNRMTWRNVKVTKRMPKCEMCIAVSIMDLNSARETGARYKALWLRGAEWKWLTDKQTFLHDLTKFVSAGGKIVCNAQWLSAKLTKYGFNAKTCYVGLRLDKFRDHGRVRGDKTIGYLYSDRESKRYADCKRLMKLLEPHGYEFRYFGAGYELHGQKLIDFYNTCTYWFSPSILEGFHRVPAEAALCGCLVVAVDVPSGGTADWHYQGVTGLRYKEGCVEQAAEAILNCKKEDRETMVCSARKVLFDMIGTKEQCSKKLLEAIIYDN